MNAIPAARLSAKGSGNHMVDVDAMYYSCVAALVCFGFHSVGFYRLCMRGTTLFSLFVRFSRHSQFTWNNSQAIAPREHLKISRTEIFIVAPHISSWI